jgi:hypothetical protein
MGYWFITMYLHYLKISRNCWLKEDKNMLGLHLKYHSLLHNALKFVQNIIKLHSYIILKHVFKSKDDDYWYHQGFAIPCLIPCLASGDYTSNMFVTVG